MRPTLVTATLAITLAIIAPALAAGPNGGQTSVSEGHPIEFVASDKEVTFFVTDEDGKPLATAGMSAKVYLSAGGKTETLVLTPASPNKLVGVLGAPLTLGTKIVLSSKVHGHHLQARFEK